MTTDRLELESRRDHLESSIDLLGKVMIAFTAVVTVGLLLELVPPIRELLKTGDSGKLYDVSGGLLVAVGVAGELLVEFRAHRKEHRLREVNADLEFASKTQIAELEKQVSLANSAAAESHERAEREISARVKLEESILPRRIPVVRLGANALFGQAAVAGAVSGEGAIGQADQELVMFSGIKAVIRVVEDLEARRLARNLVDLLTLVEWEVLQVELRQFDLQDGVFIHARSSMSAPTTEPERAGKMLVYKLGDYKIQARCIPRYTGWFAGISEDTLIIEIGLHPNQYSDERLHAQWMASLDEETRKRFEARCV